MVHINEIMIGDWFEHNANWSYRSPSKIQPFLFQWDDRDWYALSECTLDLNDIKPIEISVDILEKSGFTFKEDEDNDWYIKTIKHVVLEADHSTEFSAVFVSCGAYSLKEIKTLHELQNFHRILTGEELTVKP